MFPIEVRVPVRKGAILGDDPQAAGSMPILESDVEQSCGAIQSDIGRGTPGAVRRRDGNTEGTAPADEIMEGDHTGVVVGYYELVIRQGDKTPEIEQARILKQRFSLEVGLG